LSRLPRNRARLLALALAAVAPLGLSCGTSRSEPCPGEPIAKLELRGTRVDAATACAGEPPGGWIVVGQVPGTIPPDGSSFTATLTSDPASGSAALCTGRRLSEPLRGTSTDGHVHLEAATDGGAVLGGCAGTCSARLTVIVDGDLTAGVAGAPPTFTGTLVERMDVELGPDGRPPNCGSCILPCTATFALAPVVH
jgi:hypothetical protein